MSEARSEFDAEMADLVDRRILGIEYWDIHLFGEPRVWDHDDWHHAVMGIDFSTDRGPFSVSWTTSKFELAALDPRSTPMRARMVTGPEGPEHWSVTSEPRWQQLINSPLRGATTRWEPCEADDGRGIRHLDVPMAVRLDFDDDAVWLVAGTPNWPDVEDVFLPGDEILVVFTADRMKKIGFPDDAFLVPSADGGSGA